MLLDEHTVHFLREFLLQTEVFYELIIQFRTRNVTLKQSTQSFQTTEHEWQPPVPVLILLTLLHSALTGNKSYVQIQQWEFTQEWNHLKQRRKTDNKECKIQ